ncbi:hypothetical protein [Pseudomonas asiatica]|uniref:hypothetical protein n=1 Tax=Pseudomonas asiatica TaxID=2219225 RepID=UPI000B304D18
MPTCSLRRVRYERTVAEQPGQAQQHHQHQRVPSDPFESPDPLLHAHVILDGVMP